MRPRKYNKSINECSEEIFEDIWEMSSHWMKGNQYIIDTTGIYQIYNEDEPYDESIIANDMINIQTKSMLENNIVDIQTESMVNSRKNSLNINRNTEIEYIQYLFTN